LIWGAGSTVTTAFHLSGRIMKKTLKNILILRVDPERIIS